VDGGFGLVTGVKQVGFPTTATYLLAQIIYVFHPPLGPKLYFLLEPIKRGQKELTFHAHSEQYQLSSTSSTVTPTIENVPWTKIVLDCVSQRTGSCLPNTVSSTFFSRPASLFNINLHQNTVNSDQSDSRLWTSSCCQRGKPPHGRRN
jgi:hypothetical protein